MPARKQAAVSPAPGDTSSAAAQHPPFWIADRVLPVGTEMGAGYARAFSPGDRVPVEHVEKYGWQDYVSAPEGDWPTPEIPEQAEPTSAAATPGGTPEASGPGAAGSAKE